MKQKRRTANTFHRESEIVIFICITLSPLLYADPLGFFVFFYVPTARLSGCSVCMPPLTCCVV